MADRSLQSSIRAVLRRLKVKEVRGLTDAELLTQYATTRDEAAFTALVSRHGPTVLSVCRRVLRDHDVDDAFQAAFLALAKEAGSIRLKGSVGVWLYEVAYHAALKVRARTLRNHHVERAAATSEVWNATDEVAYRDMQQVLDEELHRLPERLRRPIVLVHLLGHLQADAASELGITDRTLRNRLKVAREKLRVGLSRRGVTLTTAALVATLEQAAAAAAVPPSLLRPTIEAVLAYAAGHTAAVPAATISLAMAGAGGWLAGRLKLVGLLLAVPALAAVVFTVHALSPRSASNSAPPPKPPVPPVVRAEVADGRTQVLTGQVIGANGRPVPHAAVTALVRRPWQAAERGLHDAVVAQGTADAAGWYRLAVPADFPTWYPERRVTLLAHAPGHAPITGEVSLRGRPAATDLRLAGACTVRGQLLGPDGQAAAGVRLAVVRLGHAARELSQGEEPPPAPPGWPADTTTDVDGRFRLDGLPSGEQLWLQVQDDRYALSTFPVTAGGAEAATVTLSEPRLFVGQVVAADTRRPLGGARVAVFTGSRSLQAGHYTALASAPDAAAAAPAAELSGRANAEGRFRFRLPPGTDYHVFIHPPGGTAYAARQARLTWAEGEASREQLVLLVPGVEVRGQVVEEDGRPIAGACAYYALPSPRRNTSLPSDTVPFRDTATLTGADGCFRIVVPAVSCRLEVFGPTADYRQNNYEYQPCPYCISGHLVRMFEHGLVNLNLAPGDRPEPVRVTLRRGTTVTGRVVGPDGESIREGVAVCRTVAHPLRSPVPRTLPIRDGVFELPGCVPGRTYPVLFLDAAHRFGALAELHVPGPGESPPTIRLTACGSAQVRLVDAAGRPLAGCRPLVRCWLGHDRPPGEAHATADRTRPDPIYTSWIDALNYLPGPTTDADGLVVLPALVAGPEYGVGFVVDDRREYRTRLFQVTPGQTVRLPEIVADEHDGGHTGDTP
jgi:RNA polymerase sigma factor (sigma-70 family)